MDAECLPEFDGAYLEDSYFLGMVCEGVDLHLDVLFALTTDHPDYLPPAAGEQQCYRRGRLVLSNPSVLELKPGPKPTVLNDPDGTLDLGSIELRRCKSGAIWIITEWFELTARVTNVSVCISPGGS